MKQYPCPSCGAQVVFRTSIAAYAVCPYCHTMLVRDDDNLKKIGEMAQLPDDMSPFQIGTGGVYNGVHFGIVGRLKIGWAEGSWNEWFIVSDDGRKGWLAEAQGFYSPCFEISAQDAQDDTKQALDDFAEWGKGHRPERWGSRSPLGTDVTLNGKKYLVVDVQDAECIGCSGELPFSAPQGRKTKSIDLMDNDGGFASIEVSAEGTRLFIGHYVEWEQLKCSFFREFEGW